MSDPSAPLTPVSPLSLTFRKASCCPLQDVTEEAGLPDNNWLEKH